MSKLLSDFEGRPNSQPEDRDHVCEECEQYCEHCNALECMLTEEFNQWKRVETGVGAIYLCPKCVAEPGSKRRARFDSYATHPWLKKIYAKLNKEEMKIAHDFIAKNDHLDVGEFEFAVNRMFLDKPKPKHFTIILELVSNSNCALK